MKRLWSAATLAAVVAVVAVCGPPLLHAGPDEGVSIDYEGRLLDEARKPVAGVFPLEFRLYRTQDSEAPLWKESHWVAIADGKYHLRLGQAQKIRAQVVKPGDNLFLGVNLQDGDELTREPITIPGGAPKPAPAKPAEQATGGEEAQVLPRVGGTGGQAYVRECPPGMVVTGIRGSAGATIDSIQLICSPLPR